MEDSAIVALYWERSEKAIAASEEKYGTRCRGLSFRILESREDAEECVNDTWQRAWETMPPQRPESLGAYLMKIVRNLSLDRWRAKAAKKRGLEVILEELEDCVPPSPSAETAAEEREIAQCVDRWLETLPPEDRAAFLGRYWYGFAVKELARRLEVSPGKMAGRLYRLRRGLRKALEEEGVAL